MPVRTAAQFLDALRDERDISIEGERVRDIAGDPRFAGAARAMARLMEMQHEPALHEIMTYESPDTGDRVGMTHIQPRSREDVVARNDAIKLWMDSSCGMLGRSPDFKNVMISAYAAAGERFDRDAFKGGDNIRAFHRHVRENDLITTHVLVNPQVDRSRPAHLETSDVVARIVGETDAGVVIRGARMVATLCALADELLVMPAASRWSDEMRDTTAYSFGFAVPVSTPGLRFICRPPVAQTNAPSILDHPLSLQYDESDGLVIFDDVTVPWERVFIYRDPEFDQLVNPQSHTLQATLMQSVVRATSKSEFMMALTLAVARASRIDVHNPVQVQLAETIAIAEFARTCRVAAEAESRETEFGTWVAGHRPLQTWQSLYWKMYNRQCEILNTLGAGGMVAVPSYAEVAGELRGSVETYFQSANASAPERIRLLRLAFDASLSSFAGRQRLYEQFYTGDPMRTQALFYRMFDTDTHIARIHAMLDELEARDG